MKIIKCWLYRQIEFKPEEIEHLRYMGMFPPMLAGWLFKKKYETKSKKKNK